MQTLTVPPVTLAMLAACVIAAVALTTVSSVIRTVRSQRQAKLLARALQELESARQLHDGERDILDERLRRMEHALEVLTVEMERVGEGQRYITRLLSPAAKEA